MHANVQHYLTEDRNTADTTREAPTASPKSLPISGAENEPSGHGEVLLL